MLVTFPWSNGGAAVVDAPLDSFALHSVCRGHLQSDSRDTCVTIYNASIHISFTLDKHHTFLMSRLVLFFICSLKRSSWRNSVPLFLCKELNIVSWYSLIILRIRILLDIDLLDIYWTRSIARTVWPIQPSCGFCQFNTQSHVFNCQVGGHRK